MERISQISAELEASSAYKTLTAFFDEGSFVEVGALAGSESGIAEAMAGYGTVEGLPVYAFAQNSDVCGGAMSKAQAAKLKKIYDLALKTGGPVVGFYDSVGARLAEGNALLEGWGEVLNKAAALSGVVPQISVVLGSCLGTGALNASSADTVIMTESAQLSLDVTGQNSDARYNAAHGTADIISKDSAQAIAEARRLITYLPSNNLNSAPSADSEEPDPNESCGCIVSEIVDGGSKLKLGDAYGDKARTRLCRLGGQSVGVINTRGGIMDAQSAYKTASFVRFCDAFSIPLITFADCSGFEALKSAARLTAAFAEATTIKLAVVTGEAIGSAYIALAGAGANADAVYALENAVISPVNTEAAAFIMAPETMKVPVKEQKAAADKYAADNLSALKAAENGYVDGVISKENVRAALIAALDMLSGKRVTTMPKKHSVL